MKATAVYGKLVGWLAAVISTQSTEVAITIAKTIENSDKQKYS